MPCIRKRRSTVKESLVTFEHATVNKHVDKDLPAKDMMKDKHMICMTIVLNTRIISIDDIILQS